MAWIETKTVTDSRTVSINPSFVTAIYETRDGCLVYLQGGGVLEVAATRAELLAQIPGASKPWGDR